MGPASMVLTVILLWFISYLWSLGHNYLRARASGLPIVVCLTNPDNFVYLLIKVPLRPLFERFLPRALYENIKLSIYGWEWRDKYAVHARVGPTFMLVTPGPLELWTADPSMAHAILGRRKDFVQLRMGARIMGVMGPNIITTDGDAWARQRRIVAPNLNERVMGRVWEEGTRQAQEMLHFLLEKKNGETEEAIGGLQVIAMNVLGQVAYGQRQSWSTKEASTDPKAELTYFDCISSIISLLVPAAFVPSSILRLPIMPPVVQTLGKALQEMPSRTIQILNQERELAKMGIETRNNLMSMLVRLSDEGKRQEAGKKVSANAQYLTEEEIQGNLFLFTAAGFDATANTMAYAVTMLAAYPAWQQWIHEELDQVLGDLMKTGSPDYENSFPKLTRCLALMYETLRLFTPVIHLSKETISPQTMTTDLGTYSIPAGANVFINNVTLHSNPSIWGDDSLEFRPTRWLASDSIHGSSQFVSTPRGTFLPWSAGPRVCPGQKMSQVEFVSVVATLFHQCTVLPVVQNGQSKEQAHQRLLDLAQDSQSRLTLQMNKPKEVKLRWGRRSTH